MVKITFIKLVNRVLSIKSKFKFKKCLDNFRIEGQCRIIGGEYIQIGSNFSSGFSFWIQAIRKYGDQYFNPEIIIGNDVSCSDLVHIASINSIRICDGVLVGSKVHITDHSHGKYNGIDQDKPDTLPAHRKLNSIGPVVINKNVWICDGVVILSGVIIGENAIIGANSVVNRDIPPNTIAVGAPAKPIKVWNESECKWDAI